MNQSEYAAISEAVEYLDLAAQRVLREKGSSTITESTAIEISAMLINCFMVLTELRDILNTKTKKPNNCKRKIKMDRRIDE